MTPTGKHWLVAGLLSLAGHALVLADGSQRFESAAERAAGVPAAIWGVTAHSVMIELEPATPIEEIPEPVEAAKVNPLERPVVHTVKTLAEAKPPLTPVEEIAKPVEAVEVKPLELPVVHTVKPQADLVVTALAEEAAVAAPELIEANEPLVEAKPPRAKKKKTKKTSKEKQRAARASGGPVGRAAGSRGSASSASGRSDYNSYAGQVIAHLRRYKRYPPGAGSSRVWGTVRLKFVVGKSGNLQSVRLTGGSGHAILDREALSMVHRASPFPSFPSALTRTTMTFTVPILFKRQ